jgi:hypothetical protein
LDIVPVDFVASALVWSAGRQDTIGRILHLCSGAAGSIDIMDLRQRVQAIFREHGVKLTRPLPVPMALFRGAIPIIGLLVSEKTRRALRTLPIFFDYLGEDQAFANTETLPLLASAGIHLPPVEQYVDRLIGHYVERRP